MTVNFKTFNIFTFFEIWAQNIFFPNEGIPARTAIRTIGSFRLLSMPPACGFCAGQLILEVAPVVLDAKEKCNKNGGTNSREVREKRD